MRSTPRVPGPTGTALGRRGSAPISALDHPDGAGDARTEAAGRAKTRRHPKAATIRDLVSYRLARASSLMSRGAALRYRREFGVSLGEWRALALLAAGAPQSVMQLTRAAGLDKAQMSRVVASLITRGFVVRETPANGGRAVALGLTPAGSQTYAGLIAAAAERDRAFRAALTPEEAAVLETALDKLAKEALRFVKAEMAKAEA